MTTFLKEAFGIGAQSAMTRRPGRLERPCLGHRGDGFVLGLPGVWVEVVSRRGIDVRCVPSGMSG